MSRADMPPENDDALVLPYTLDRKSIIRGQRYANEARWSGIARIPARIALAYRLAVLSILVFIFGLSLLKIALPYLFEPMHLRMSWEFVWISLGVFFVFLVMYCYYFVGIIHSHLWNTRADLILDAFGAIPTDGRISLSRRGILVENRLGMRAWAPPVLRSAYETRDDFVFVSKALEVISLSKHTLTPEQVEATSRLVRSGVLGGRY